MQFLHKTTIEEITDKEVGVILRSNAETVDTIAARIFLKNGQLFIDCVPALRRKYVVMVPDDATVARAHTPDPPWQYAIFVHPNSEAGRFITSLLDSKIILNN